MEKRALNELMFQIGLIQGLAVSIPNAAATDLKWMSIRLQTATERITDILFKTPYFEVDLDENFDPEEQ